MALLLPAALLFISTALVNSLARHSSRSSYLVGLFVIAYAQLVLVGEVGSLLGLLGSRGFFFAAHLILALLSLALWSLGKRPSLAGGLAWSFSRHGLYGSLREWPDLGAFSVIIGGCYAFGIFLILYVAPNNGDGLETYLARVAFWIQHGNLNPVPGGTSFMYSFPPNAQLQILWTVLFWGSDQLSGFVQWFSAVTVAITVYGLSRFFDRPRPASLFAGLLWLGFTSVILHSTTVQHDLVLAALLMSCVYFLFVGLREERRPELLLSAVALGLALGTKLSVLFFYPGLALTVVLIVWLRVSPNWRLLRFWLGSVLGASLALGAFIYLLNFALHRNPLGPFVSVEMDAAARRAGTGSLHPVARAFYDVVYYFYRSFDVTGLPGRMADWLFDLYHFAASPLLRLLGVPAHLIARPRPPLAEDTAWYGPLSWMLLYPAAVWQAIRAWRARDGYRLSLVLLAVSFAGCFAVTVPAGNADGRYLAFSFAALAPFAAWLFEAGILRVLRWTVVFVTFLVVYVTSTQNLLKPLVGPSSIVGKDRVEMQNINRPSLTVGAEAFEQIVPENATVGITGFPRKYLVFGRDLSRRVFEVFPPGRLTDKGWLRKQGIQYLVVGASARGQVKIEGYDLLVRSDEPQAKEFGLYGLRIDSLFGEGDPVVRKALLASDSVPRHFPLIACAPELAGKVGLHGLRTAGWSVERDGNRSCLWIGQGEEQGLTTSIWSAESRIAFLDLTVQPGPSRSDSSRTISVRLRSRNSTSKTERTYEASTQLRFMVPLSAGWNELCVADTDRPTQHAPHDPRTLLTLLSKLVLSGSTAPAAGPGHAALVKIRTDGESLLGLSPLLKVPWTVEEAGGRSWFWAGSGPEEGLGFELWALSGGLGRFEVEAEAGPCREDLQRHLLLEARDSAGGTLASERRSFAGKARVSFDLPLQQGLNQLVLYCTDQPTRRLPTDSRRLLVRIDSLEVSSP